MTAFFWKSYLKLSGWDTSIVFPYDGLKKYIMIVAPHTSNWDFIIGVAYRSLLGLQNVKFLGKKELFKPPFGFIFRFLGGIPVDRKRSQHMVDEVAGLFEQHETFAIALSPEGTRKKVDKLRTGFYFIAAKAKVPIIMVGFDYQLKKVIFSEPFIPTDQKFDFENIINFYRPVSGRHPELGLMDK